VDIFDNSILQLGEGVFGKFATSRKQLFLLVEMDSTTASRVDDFTSWNKKKLTFPRQKWFPASAGSSAEKP